MRIAFLGLGLMGAPMARNLLAAGHALTVWNRSPGKAAPLVQAGAAAAPSAAEAAAGAELVITMLENGPIVEAVLFGGVDAAIPAGSIVADMSSIRPAEAQDHARRLAARGVHHLDAPVSGGTTAATDGTLAIMAGGEAEVFARAEPALRALGRPVLVGPSGAGQLAKLANQVIVGATIGAVAEAFLIAARGGADPARLREALRGGFAESRILDLHAQRMIERDFATRGRCVTHLKDLDNTLDAASRLGLGETPYTAITAGLFRDLIAAEGDPDHSALLLELERRNPARLEETTP
ncbi:NAD(P)-dependent oxidoreductase [Muricoccus pecuniae]|uniref:2-hydroxy-3-oxopropionate reductase n=1 Tax=Muricoccus pecuniae TaxID=693023 RepID=A0A840Y7M0_9PROT|nr:NAD(P)-dependent oxidoreductase [Roseomonas pecuniae]MBB5692357.1 2-hydroxy-3-oxopropionate reductase [Roseomonas pecuniae]